MKILVLHGTSDLYGSGKILVTVVETLVENNHSVIVLLSQEGPLSIALRLVGAEVKIIRLGIIRKKYFSPKGIINRIVVLKNAYRAIKKLVKDEKIELIYSNTTTVLIGAIVAKFNSVKHVWHIHEITVKPKFMYIFNGWFIHFFAQNIIAVSNAVKQHWVKYINENKITVIYNGIDTTDFEKNQGNLRNELLIESHIVIIGMIGRVNVFKGQEYFLEIAAILRSKFNNLKFILVGDAYTGYEYLYDQINTIIKVKQLESDVIDLKYRTDIPNVINSFDLLLLPSQLPDSFPTVILEAMAAGIPVVATEQGGAVEMLQDGITGYLIPISNAQIAAEKISKLISDSTLRKCMGERGKIRLKTQFNIQDFKEKLINFIEMI